MRRQHNALLPGINGVSGDAIMALSRCVDLVVSNTAPGRQTLPGHHLSRDRSGMEAGVAPETEALRTIVLLTTRLRLTTSDRPQELMTLNPTIA